MDVSSSCPSDSVLRDFITSRLVEGESRPIHEHLVVCGPCRRRVDDLETEIMPERGDRTIVPSHYPPDTSADLGIEGEPPWDPLACLEDTLDLGFLKPTTRDQSMGRLGEYEILRILGEGGMGIVFKAFDESLHRVVAIKVMAPGLASSAKARRRFIHEARAAAAINDPNVVTIHAVNIQQEIPYLVMEYVAGGSLRQKIRSGAPLGLVEILRIGAQVASGLAAAHEQGVIHRDIKPANIMLEDGVERVKITDFGLAVAAQDRSGLTSLKQMVGTPAYMSPEQVAGAAVDERTDLFSLGCVFHAMATGHSPFHGTHTLDVIRRVGEERPRPLHVLNPDIPRDLSNLVERLLDKDPKGRPRGAAEVASLLKQQLVRANQLSSSVSTPIDHPPVDPPMPRRATWHMAVPAATLALLAMGIALIFGKESDTLPGWFAVPTASRAAPSSSSRSAALTDANDDLVTVSQSGKADHATIGAALAVARPGVTIRVLDDATYLESILIDDASRWRGLVLEAARGATLASPGPGATLTVRDTPEVTIRGLRIRAVENHHAMLVRGETLGLTVEGVDFSQAAGAGLHPAVVRLTNDTPVDDRASVVIRRCRIENDGESVGISLANSKLKAEHKGRVRIEDNEFSGDGVHVLLQGAVGHVVVAGNRFLGGSNGVNLDLPLPEQAERVVIANNTFFGTTYWIGLVRTNARQGQVTICNNLIIGSRRVEWGWEGQVDEVAQAWDFRANWWEPCEGAETDRLPDPPIAEILREIPLRSRDPDSPEFLRPEPGSPIASSGAGHEFPTYIGALAPVASPPKD